MIKNQIAEALAQRIEIAIRAKKRYNDPAYKHKDESLVNFIVNVEKECVRTRTLKGYNERMGMKVDWDWPELCVEIDGDDLIGSITTEIVDLEKEVASSIIEEDYRHKTSAVTTYEEESMYHTGLSIKEQGYIPN